MDEETKSCVWTYNGHLFTHSIWKTECGREIDLLHGGEQPKKNAGWEYCPFCAGHIIDSTTDC